MNDIFKILKKNCPSVGGKTQLPYCPTKIKDWIAIYKQNSFGRLLESTKEILTTKLRIITQEKEEDIIF